MLEGVYVDNILMNPRVWATPVHPQETSGVQDWSKAHVRYSLKESEYPTLTIVTPIFDNGGNVIPAGYYELAISDDRTFFILLQSKEQIAVIPVFKIEEDANEEKRLNNKEYKKELKKEEKKRKEINEKRDKVGMRHDEEFVYMDASIEYCKDGDYYLIKYERGTLKAWGAIKR